MKKLNHGKTAAQLAKRLRAAEREVEACKEIARGIAEAFPEEHCVHFAATRVYADLVTPTRATLECAVGSADALAHELDAA